MTRFLSSALQAEEPFFRLGLRQLEAAHGNPNTDIRFSTEVIQSVKSKLLQLGLDPVDTTAKELYRALAQRLKEDDRLLTKNLRTKAATHVSAEAEVVAGMVHVIKELPETKRCFALRSSSLKTVLRKIPPKKAMKRLGYRSMESFLKHEQPVLILTAAWLTEGEAWHKRLLEQYKKLQSRDFEDRSIQLLRPDTKKWQAFAAEIVNKNHHNLISFKEAGALIFLPLPANAPSGAVTASLSMALHELNEIRSSSAFLKLAQVKPDFSQAVIDIASNEPTLKSRLLDQPISWNLIQQYYTKMSHRFEEDLFGPHLHPDDISWHPVEKTLSTIEPSFSFWHDSAHLAMLDGHKPVSFNLLDVALNYCNAVPYEKRLTHYLRQSLWHELLLRYMHHGALEKTILSEFQPQMATETVPA